MAGIKTMCYFPEEFAARLKLRAAVRYDGQHSRAIAGDLETFWSLLTTAGHRVRSMFDADELAVIRAALNTTYIEPSIIPHLADEIDEAMADSGQRGRGPLVGKLRQLGLLEMYALAQAVKNEAVTH